MRRLADASDPRTEGIAICAEMLRELRTQPGVAGASIRHAESTEDVVEILKQAG